MNELQTLREFRSEIAGARPDDPVLEQTMRALRTLVEAEARSRGARRQRRRLRIGGRRRRTVTVAVIAAATVALVAVLPARQTDSSIVGQALAAIGSGDVLHVVGETPTGRELVDLASGKRTPVIQQEEIWFDRKAGLRRDVTRVGGVIVDDVFQSPQGGWTPHGIVYDCAWIAAHPKAATRARVSCNLSGYNGTTPHHVPRPKPTLDPGLSGFADSYRGALAAGAAREDGRGVVDGRAVDWLLFATREGPERVALDVDTHKPVLIYGPRGRRMRIAAIGTGADAGGHFEKPSPSEIPLQPSGGSSRDARALSLDGAAIARAHPGALWSGPSIAGLALASATVQRLVTGYDGARPFDHGTGLQLQYGSLDARGHRDFSRPFVTVSEASSPALAIAYMWPASTGIVPPPGKLLLLPIAVAHGGTGSLAVGALMRDGLAITIQASSNDLAVRAARALAPAR